MDTTNSFFPMDLGTIPMQTDGASGPNGLPATPAQSGQQTNANANAFSGNGGVFMGVSTPPRSTSSWVSNGHQADPKTSSGEGYTMGFMIPKTS